MNISEGQINFQNLNLESEFPVAHVQAFLLNQNEYFVLKHSLFKTVNGGETFELVVNQGPNRIFGVHFFDIDTGFVTHAGRLFKTIDGGESWVEVVQVNTLSKLFFVNNSIGFLYGGSTNGPIAGGDVLSSGGVLKTTDGGQTWDDLNLSVSEINVLYFVDVNTGYFATSAEDEIYKTTDGGTTWDLVSNEVEGFINGMVFLDVNNGFVITHEGKIYRTNNGGTNWSVDYETTNGLNLSSIAKTSDGKIFVVGDDGLMLKRDEN
ncbi:MAG: YCF48-related protein [Flavobacteriaceae bacterium]|nr:YCF48-related protein [Flavobacteriaceae bacterium]